MRVRRGRLTCGQQKQRWHVREGLGRLSIAEMRSLTVQLLISVIPAETVVGASDNGCEQACLLLHCQCAVQVMMMQGPWGWRGAW
jgi:hypothetical protein